MQLLNEDINEGVKHNNKRCNSSLIKSDNIGFKKAFGDHQVALNVQLCLCTIWENINLEFHNAREYYRTAFLGYSKATANCYQLYTPPTVFNN